VLCGSSPTPTEWGLLLDFEWLFAPTDAFGLTVYSFADINGVEHFAGVALGLYVGRF
jgi:hypothetical protein